MTRRVRRDDRGYVAVLGVILAPILFGLCAFTVGTGAWYSTAGSIQRAADAASLAGVTYLPGNLAVAQAKALEIAAANGYSNAGTTVVDPEPGAGAAHPAEGDDRDRR